MNMRALERWGMAKEVWMRGERKKYYKAESDMWQMIRNVLGSRERREVDLALQVLGDSVEKLQGAEAELSPEEKELAQYYLERIADLQSFLPVRPNRFGNCFGRRRKTLILKRSPRLKLANDYFRAY